MTIESEYFRKYRFNPQKAIRYGFFKDCNCYRYNGCFHNNSFKFELVVDQDSIYGDVTEIDTGEVYIPLRVPSRTDAYVSQIREEYAEELAKIADNCFEKREFSSDQANRISEKIKMKYQVKADFPFEKNEAVVYRNSNGKWFGLLMEIEWRHLEKKSGTVEVINLKADELYQTKILKINGIYPAYHMSKKKWISVVLNDTLTDEHIMQLIDDSFRLTGGYGGLKSDCHWIIPANPSFYDIVKEFKHKKIIEWKQTVKLNVGDTVYFYAGAPYSSIMFAAAVTEADIPADEYYGNYHVTRKMKLKIIKRYPEGLLMLNVLKAYGLNSVRSTRRIPVQLQKVIMQLKDID